MTCGKQRSANCWQFVWPTVSFAIMARTQRSFVFSYEAFFLLTLIVLAAITVCRVPGLKVYSGRSIHTVVQTRQVVRGGGDLYNDNPQTVLTEVVIDSTTGNSDTIRTSSASKLAGDFHELKGTTTGSGTKNRQSLQVPSLMGFEPAEDILNQFVNRNDLNKTNDRGPAENNSTNPRSTDVGTQSVASQQRPAELKAGDEPLASQKSSLQTDATDLTAVDAAVSSKHDSSNQPNLVDKSRPEVVQNPLRSLVPADFEWETYLQYYPELKSSGVTTEDAAIKHYHSVGKGEGRVYKRLRLLLRYTACTGLMNQQYSHLSAFALAVVLGAEVVLPPAACRDSFGKHFSVFKEQNEVMWSAAPTQSLINVDQVISYWADRGIVVHRTPSISPFPDLTSPEVAYPAYDQPGIDRTRIVRLGNVYLSNLELGDLVETVRVRVMEQASEIMRSNPDLSLDYMVLELPCTFFMIRTVSNLPIIGEVAKSLFFSDTIEALAQRVINAVTNNGQSEYNGIHLRIEKDAEDWAVIMGGQGNIWNGYFHAMSVAGFTSAVPLYVASGLLTYGAHEELHNTENVLKSTGMCGAIVYKEMYVPQHELDALNSEQKALLDFIVLAKGKNFVGFGSSTFSFYLREYRALNNVPKSQSVLVDASPIGTDPLFNSAGTLV